jgi:hypothetical protein
MLSWQCSSRVWEEDEASHREMKGGASIMTPFIMEEEIYGLPRARLAEGLVVVYRLWSWGG